MRFTVEIEQTDAGYELRCSETDGTDFATVYSNVLWTGMQMLVPYMVAVAQPDPFADLIRQVNEVAGWVGAKRERYLP